MVMDAEAPDFPDEEFDVIVSRNLTWTLPDAEHAYQEWFRVLKPGGVMINLDANYGGSRLCGHCGSSGESCPSSDPGRTDAGM